MVELLLHGYVMFLHSLFEFIVSADCEEVNVNVGLHCTCAGQFAYFLHAITQFATAYNEWIQPIWLLNHIETDVHQGFQQEFPPVHSYFGKPDWIHALELLIFHHEELDYIPATYICLEYGFVVTQA